VNGQKNRSFPQRLRWALSGLAHAIKSEHSLKLQLVLFGVTFLVLLLLRPGPAWWALVLLSSAVVIAAELFNTAIEHLADHLHPALHPQIRIVKDCAAAGVLIAVLGALAVAAALLAHLVLKLHLVK
jgi:diacylglycerol kinase (ATP)